MLYRTFTRIFFTVLLLLLFQHAWVWLLWLLSQTWITLHIWTPKCERLASTEKLFVTPMYNGLLIDQSLGMNRRRDDEADVKTEVGRKARVGSESSGWVGKLSLSRLGSGFWLGRVGSGGEVLS